MKYIPIPLSERTKRIKECYLSLPVAQETNPYKDKKYRRFCTGDRWITLGYLRGWQKYSNAKTTLLRTSCAEAEELYQAEPVITDDELLVGHLYLPEYTPDEQAEYDKLCDMFQMSSHTLVERPPRKDHICLDYEKLVKVGINGLKKEIEENLSKLEYGSDIYPGYESIQKREFYQCLITELDAVLDLAGRYAQKAYQMSEQATEPRKSELIRIADIMSRVPSNPAENFYEAIQSVQFFLSSLFGLYPLGRPDRYLYEFYKRDIENGTITREFAQELVDNFCLHITDRVFSRAACGFIVGGRDKNGKNIENELTYMFLTALDHLKLPDPNGALAVNSDTSDEILKYCTEILSHGTTHPAFYNDDAIIPSLVENYGCEYEDSVTYIHSTCAELSIAGKSKSHTTPYVVNLVGTLLDIAKKEYNSFDELYEAYIQWWSVRCKELNVEYLTRMLEASRIGNEPMRICALVDNCIERGKSIYAGGEKYTFIQPTIVGFGTAVDSLLAIKKLVFEEKKLTLFEFNEILDNNFEGNEEFRQNIRNKLPHYGNDNEEADELAKGLAQRLMEIFKDNSLPAAKIMMPGMFTYVNHGTIGQRTGASFDGRLAQTSFSDGCGPVQGLDKNGPTSMIKSLTSWNEEEFLGGVVVNVKFSKDGLSGDNADRFISILKTFINLGGIEFQVNVVDRATLEDARINPDRYPELIVRIGGYSDYFTRLTPVLQQEVIERTEY